MHGKEKCWQLEGVADASALSVAIREADQMIGGWKNGHRFAVTLLHGSAVWTR
jgi:hypothetical protein